MIQVHKVKLVASCDSINPRGNHHILASETRTEIICDETELINAMRAGAAQYARWYRETLPGHYVQIDVRAGELVVSDCSISSI